MSLVSWEVMFWVIGLLHVYVKRLISLFYSLVGKGNPQNLFLISFYRYVPET